MDWLALELFDKGMVRIGRFILTSGMESPFYIDLRRLWSYPSLARRVVEEAIARFDIRRFDAVVGVATGGIPFAAYVAALCGMPMAYVRSEKKEHGTRATVEGDVSGLKVVVLDDVATTGSSLERAVNALREAGADPRAAIVIVDREQGARERLAKLGVELYSLTTARRIFEVLRAYGRIDEDTYTRILRYLESSCV